VVVVSSCRGAVELRVDDEFEDGEGVKRRRLIEVGEGVEDRRQI